MAKVIMIQGTMSNAGKSLVAAGLCRVFSKDGYLVAPFKSQNMALNSFITKDGLEMGRAQVMQAEAAGIEPVADMNPILLKPTNDTGSQVIVNGKVRCQMSAANYFKYKKELIPDIKAAFKRLADKFDIIVIEGAGSPAEINLKENDIVNMGLAKMLGAPVLLVGDIDRGGVFAQLLGTLMLLEDDEKALVKGLVINKFRGDKTLLDPGIDMLTEKGGIPTVGVLPYTCLSLDDEDSLSERLENTPNIDAGINTLGKINIAVVRLPRISNFTDFSAFDPIKEVNVIYVTNPSEIEKADMVIIPGSKNTIGDMKWMRTKGIEAAIKKFAAKGGPVFGICGGYQMLGLEISDPESTEDGGRVLGMNLLSVITEMKPEKTRRQVTGNFGNVTGIFSGLSGKELIGYEIHMGETRVAGNGLCTLENENGVRHDGIAKGNIYGTYVHGIFDNGDIAETIVKALAKKKGLELTGKRIDMKKFKEQQYDILEDMIRKNMDMDGIYAMLADAKTCIS